MEWNLLPVLNCEGKRLSVTESVLPTGCEMDSFRIMEPILVSAEVFNIGGSLELTYNGEAKLEMICDRCAEPFTKEVAFSGMERLKKEDPAREENQDDDVTILDGTTIDLDELVYRGLILNLPTKVLCCEDCKGLCPVCGGNLNQGDCGCDTTPTDPRFDVLDQLL